MHRFTRITSRRILSHVARGTTATTPATFNAAPTTVSKTYAITTTQFSTTPNIDTAVTPANQNLTQQAKQPNLLPTPPTSLSFEKAIGINATTLFYLRHGLGNRLLKDLAKHSGDATTLVQRWQTMMETFLGTQVHVIAGLGYPLDERGLAMFNEHMARLMQYGAEETEQAQLRDEARVLWKTTLSTAFGVTMEEIEGKEVGVVEARDMMHRVATRMQDPGIIEMVAKRTGGVTEDDPVKETTKKHTIVQEILVKEVYLGGEPQLVEQLGFGSGEKGYVLFQCSLADYQSDPLVSQYIGTAMFRILKVAGLDDAMMESMAGGGTAQSQ